MNPTKSATSFLRVADSPRGCGGVNYHPMWRKIKAERQTLDWVVLLHGLFATQRSMKKIERRLTDAGYHVVNWRYRTFLRSTLQHVEQLLMTIRGLQDDPDVDSINFVTHSMGGILVRGALHFGSGHKVRRIVMLAPPNCGSKLTRISLGPFAWICPAVADLSEAPDSLPNRMKSPQNVEFGVIAAQRDLIVPLASTLLTDQRDHCVMPTTHFQLPRHEATVNQVLCFLETGSFARRTTSERAA